MPEIVVAMEGQTEESCMTSTLDAFSHFYSIIQLSAHTLILGVLKKNFSIKVKKKCTKNEDDLVES